MRQHGSTPSHRGADGFLRKALTYEVSSHQSKFWQLVSNTTSERKYVYKKKRVRRTTVKLLSDLWRSVKKNLTCIDKFLLKNTVCIIITGIATGR
jgi:hypothetical protein